VARHALRNYEPHEVPSDHVPTRTTAARLKFAEVLEFLEASAV
jgi:acyl-CoA dehydrogenase